MITIRRVSWARHLAWIGKNRNSLGLQWGNLQVRDYLGVVKCRCKWISMAQNMDQWRAVVNTVKKTFLHKTQESCIAEQLSAAREKLCFHAGSSIVSQRAYENFSQCPPVNTVINICVLWNQRMYCYMHQYGQACILVGETCNSQPLYLTSYLPFSIIKKLFSPQKKQSISFPKTFISRFTVSRI